MSAGDAAGAAAREANPLVRRVDELLRRRETDEVPLLTDVLEAKPRAAHADCGPQAGALAAELERALLARLAPELDRRFALLRAEIEKELRRAVREAAAAALGARTSDPPSEG